MTDKERLDRIETLLALALHTYDGPTKNSEPGEAARYILLLHELRADVSHRAERHLAGRPRHDVEPH